MLLVYIKNHVVLSIFFILVTQPNFSYQNVNSQINKGKCTDILGWVDILSESCAFYEINGCSNAFQYANENGMDATIACCFCGGGIIQDWNLFLSLVGSWEMNNNGWALTPVPDLNTFVGHSGSTFDGENSTLSFIITIRRKHCLSFWWKVSSEWKYDYLIFLIDTNEIQSYTGEQPWNLVRKTIPSGVHAISWIYSKDVGMIWGEDKGWIANITFESGHCNASQATSQDTIPSITTKAITETTASLIPALSPSFNTFPIAKKLKYTNLNVAKFRLSELKINKFSTNRDPCIDYEGWSDKWEDSCDWYEIEDTCEEAQIFSGDIPATEACCFCGGGKISPKNHTSTSTPISDPKLSLTPSPTSKSYHRPSLTPNPTPAPNKIPKCTFPITYILNTTESILSTGKICGVGPWVYTGKKCGDGSKILWTSIRNTDLTPEK